MGPFGVLRGPKMGVIWGPQTPQIGSFGGTLKMDLPAARPFWGLKSPNPFFTYFPFCVTFGLLSV